MPLRIPAPKTLSDLIINVDKDWAGKNITNLGSGAFDLNAKFSDIPASAWATVFSTTFPIATVLNDHTKAAHDALGIAPAAHAPTHKDGGADELDVSELAGALGSAGEIPESDGDAVSWVEPDGRYDPKAHVLATTGPHTGTLPLTDLAAGARGEIITRTVADWAALGVGVAGEALLSGGAGADVSWGAPAPAAHAASHLDGAGDEIDAADLAGTGGNAGDIIESDGNALSYVDPDGRYDPKAHVLATTGPHTGTLPLIDLEVGVQGNIIHRGAADWAALAIGSAGEALLSGGAAADVSWGAPAPATHESTHVRAGADAIDAPLDARALAMTAQGDMVYLTSVANVTARLAAGTAGQALLTGGPAANPYFGAPAPAAHAASHKDGAADELDVAELAGAIGSAGEIPETDGDAVSWVEPDGRYDPKAHVIATTGPHTGTLPLTDLAAGVQGNVIIRGAADWEALAVGVSGQALLTGGAAADPSWGAPAPAVHATTHQSGGSDEIRNMEWLTALANLGYSGDTSLVTVGENVVGGDTLFLQNDGKYWKSDADAAATMPVKVMAVETILADATGLVLHDGYYRNDTLYDWTPGAGAANLLFADVNPGALVQLAGQPAGAGDQIQVCGWIVNENQICFRPSLELIEHS